MARGEVGRMIGGIAMAGRGLAAAALAALACGPAWAQVDTRSKAPIDITANQAEVIASKCLAVWRGAAEALQGQSRLRADVISVYSTPKAASKGAGANGQPACGNADRIVADGHVYYVTPEQNARGDHAVYSAAADEIVMTGDVIVVQGKDVARGDKLTLKVASREARLESNRVGAGKPGRVRAVYFPNPATPGGPNPGNPSPASPNPDPAKP
jgi:lipopolysaccharide export system protein LptA